MHIPRSRLGAAIASIAAVLIMAIVVATAGPAAAHVSVNPDEAPQGGYAALTFRVPNEEDAAATVKLEVELPGEGVTFRVKPVPGWTAAVTPTTITWSGGRIEPGQFQEFEISGGPLPESGSVTFKAVQTYDDGDVVRWIEPSPAGGPEPERPAPVVKLLPSSGEGDDATIATSSTLSASSPDTDDGDSDGGRVNGAYGVSVAALALAVVALVRSRRRS